MYYFTLAVLAITAITSGVDVEIKHVAETGIVVVTPRGDDFYVSKDVDGDRVLLKIMTEKDVAEILSKLKAINNTLKDHTELLDEHHDDIFNIGADVGIIREDLESTKKLIPTKTELQASFMAAIDEALETPTSELSITLTEQQALINELAFVSKLESVCGSGCEPGYYEKTPCSADTKTVCEECKEGTYSLGGHPKACMPIKVCGKGEFTLKKGSKTNNAICQTCKKACADGEFMESPCSSEKDTVCRPCKTCSKGFYQSKQCDAVQAGQCAKCSTCSGNLEEFKPCGIDHDARCCKKGIDMISSLVSYAPASSALRNNDPGHVQIDVLKAGTKTAANRACYSWFDVPEDIEGALFLRGDNDKNGNVEFTVAEDVVVGVIMDGRYGLIVPHGFTLSSNKIVFSHKTSPPFCPKCSSGCPHSDTEGQVDFKYATKRFKAGSLVKFYTRGMNYVFVMCDEHA
eukprot:m.38042 g.38042  ORF g.38042 m.38042 type:complete len:461 (+) comp9385_c0_seq1:3057-4439(+)